MGSRIVFWFIRVLSWIPDFLLRGLARIVEWLLKVLIGYRKQVISNNLTRAFPEMDEKARIGISNRYYRHLAQIFAEMIRFVRIPAVRSFHRISFEDESLLRNSFAEKKNLVILTGHYGNWEWNILAILATGYRLLAVYKPQSSVLVNDLMKQIRHKKGLTLVPMKETLRVLHQEEVQKGTPYVLLLIADQIPAKGDIHFWTQFLNQETAFFTGGEKIARRFKMPVLYLDQQKHGFGKYTATVKEIYDGFSELPPDEITIRFANCLEASIRRQPELWLWSHRRWKYPKEDIHLPS